jgi:drug/metabolite transporter (DMT)-like permease
MVGLYRSLLRLYPADYFHEYAAEMTFVFSQAQATTCGQSLRVRALFWAREISGVVAGALRQRFFGPDWNLSRRFDMRPEFRFPRSTVFLMCVILAGVLLAIQQAESISFKYGGPETITVWSNLPWPLLFVLVALCIGVAAWGILFALRRTGVHRLDTLQTWPDQDRE